MCQSKSEGGRRCSCDSSQSRQSRRVAQKIRSSVTIEATSAPVVAEESPVTVPPSLEVIKEQAARTQKKVEQMRMGMLPAAAAEQEVTELGKLIAARAESEVEFPDMEHKVREHNKAKEDFTVNFVRPRTAKLEELKLQVKRMNQNYRDGLMGRAEYDASFTKVKEMFDSTKGEIKTEMEFIKEKYETPLLEHRRKLADKYKEILGQIRDYGGELNMLSADSKNKKQGKLLQKQMDAFPSSWIQSAHAWEVKVKKTTSRAHYHKGAVQKKQQNVLDVEVVTKPSDWEPDANDPDHREYVRLEDISPENTSKDGIYLPASRHRMYSRFAEGDTDSYWIRPSYTKTITRVGDPPPKGRGWERAGDVTGLLAGDEETAVLWRRKKNKRITLDSYAMAEITISERDAGSFQEPGADVAMHEFSHHLEYTHKGISQLEEAFLKRRTTLPNGEREKLVALHRGEYVRKDNFVEAYMGKEYSNFSREVLSTGQEALFSGSYGGLVGHNGYKSDPDMRGFILGLHASA